MEKRLREGVFGRDCEGKGICILAASVKKGR